MTLHPVLIAVPPTANARSPECVNRQRECARLALSKCAALIGAPPAGWHNDADDRPLPNQGFHWSVSHKRHWAAAIVANQPAGIDIERMIPRRQDLLDELGTPTEWEILGDRSWHSFFRLWTAKEAVLKANGRGIGAFSACVLSRVEDLHRMTLEYESAAWRVEHYYLTDHLAAAAFADANVHWHIIEDAQAPERQGDIPVDTKKEGQDHR